MKRIIANNKINVDNNFIRKQFIQDENILIAQRALIARFPINLIVDLTGLSKDAILLLNKNLNISEHSYLS